MYIWCYGVMDVITFPENLSFTGGLSILLHGVISLPNATSCDSVFYSLKIDFGLANSGAPNETLHHLASHHVGQDTPFGVSGLQRAKAIFSWFGYQYYFKNYY